MATKQHYLKNKHGLNDNFVPTLNPNLKLEQLQLKDVSELSPEQGMILSFACSGEIRSRMRIEIDKERDVWDDDLKKIHFILLYFFLCFYCS